MTRAVRAGHLIQAKGIGPSISTRNGVPMSAKVSQTQRRSIQRNLRCPRAYLAREWARWTRTPDEVTNRPDESLMTCGCEWKEMRGTGVPPRTGGVLANIPSRLGLEPTTAPRVPTSMETPNKSPGSSRSNLDLQGRIVEALVAELERKALRRSESYLFESDPLGGDGQ
jgi:hypothetical protein